MPQVSPLLVGFNPEAGRVLIRNLPTRLLAHSGLVLGLLTAGAVAAGLALQEAGSGRWPGRLSLISFSIAFSFGSFGIVDALYLIVWSRRQARRFREAWLVPGLVVSTRPLAAVVLTPIGVDATVLLRVPLDSLPEHNSRTGTRVPFLAVFQPVGGLDSRFTIVAEPISWGTGRPEQLADCVQRLGPQSFERLEALIGRGVEPTGEFESIRLGPHDQPISI